MHQCLTSWALAPVAVPGTGDWSLRVVGVTSAWKPPNSDPTATGAGGCGFGWCLAVALATAVGGTLEMSPSQDVLQQGAWCSLYTNPKGVESIPVGAGAPLGCGIKGKESWG